MDSGANECIRVTTLGEQEWQGWDGVVQGLRLVGTMGRGCTRLAFSGNESKGHKHTVTRCIRSLEGAIK